jgi:hypothetical protein
MTNPVVPYPSCEGGYSGCSGKKGYLAVIVLFLSLSLLAGCASWRGRDDGKFEMEEKDPHPFVEPQIIGSHMYLSTTMSGMLQSLTPSRIVVDDLPDFLPGSDARVYLKSLAKKSKSEGKSFLPYHYYISSEGITLEGQDEEYCGYLGNRPSDDALLVGVLGSFEDPAEFLVGEQEKALVQLLAWLCSKHSIPPSQIHPVDEASGGAEGMGPNLASWFGSTDTLRNEVRRTLEEEKKAMEKKGAKASFLRRREERPSIESAF